MSIKDFLICTNNNQFFKKRLKKLNWITKKRRKYFLDYINKIIENRLFKPISLTIIAVFLLFKTYQYFSYFILNNKTIANHRDKISKSIKISLSGSSLSFDFEDEQIVDHEIKNGDTLLKILADVGAQDQDVFSILNALKKIKFSQSLNIGSVISITYRSQNNEENPDSKENNKVVISNVTIPSSVEENIVITRKNDGGYDARELKIKLLRYNSRYFGIIKNGLFVDGVESGI